MRTAEWQNIAGFKKILCTYVRINSQKSSKKAPPKIVKIQKCEKQNLLWVADEEAVEADDIC